MAGKRWTKFRTLRVRLSRTSGRGDDLQRQHQGHRRLPRQQAGQREARHHGDRVEQGIEDAVAGVAGGQGLLAIGLDHPGRVLGDLPGHLDGDRHRQPQADGLRSRTAAAAVEQDAVDDVGGRVPVEQLLGELGRPDVADPEADGAAGADPDPAHQVQHERLDRHQAQIGPPASLAAVTSAAWAARARIRCLRL